MDPLEAAGGTQEEGDIGMRVQWVGVVESDPHVGAGGECTLTLAANGELFQVSVSGGHVPWMASTFSAGLLVAVKGELAAPGVVHAQWVWPVEDPAD